MKKIVLFMMCCLIGVSGMAFAGGAKDSGSSGDVKMLSVATAETGSMGYMYIAAYAGHLRNFMPNLSLTTEASSGTSENIDLLYRGEVGLAAGSPERFYHAAQGTGPYQEKGKLRIGTMWNFLAQSALLVVKKSSNIKGWRDLAGKRVCVGPAGSANEIKNALILDAYGYTRKDPKRFEFNELETVPIGFPEGTNALSEGAVDAVMLTRPVPEPAVYELSLTTPLDIIPLDKDMFATIRKLYPWMWSSVIPAGVHPGQDKDLETLCDFQYLFASLDQVTEEEAYNMTKYYVEEILPKLVPQFDPLKPYGTNIANLISNWVVPGHPGAVRYYEERGYKIQLVTPD